MSPFGRQSAWIQTLPRAPKPRGDHPLMAILSRSRLGELLLDIAEQEALFSRRRFVCASAEKRKHLEEIGRTFIAGYRSALRIQPLGRLRDELDRFDDQHRGFAFEGAGMALALSDAIWRQSRFTEFLAGDGAPHRYMLYVGFGWAVARLPWLRWNPARMLKRQDPLLGALIIDGYGFHEGYFHWERTITGLKIPAAIRGAPARNFDQGLGRSLWFFNGADVDRIVSSVRSFPEHRRSDLWSGVGLAAAYAGGVSPAEIGQLREAARDYLPDAAQGAAFAAAARHKAGNLVPHTEMAARILCRQSAQQAAALTDAALLHISESAEPYEVWRTEIRKHYTTGLASGHSA